MNNLCGIYKIICIPNNKKYIGQSTNIIKRINQHKRELKGNYHTNIYLQEAWNKYKEKNFKFEVIEEIYKTNMDKEEIYWINYYQSNKRNKGFNIDGGGKYNKIVSEETKEKIRQFNLGKTISEETRQKISKTSKGRKLSMEVRKKISQLSKNRIMSKETRLKISKANRGKLAGKKNPMYGKKQPLTIREAHSKLMKGRFTGVDSSHPKKVICLTTMKIFDTIKNAATFYSIGSPHICSTCKGKRKAAGRHHITGEKLVWRYYEDYIKGGEKNE